MEEKLEKLKDEYVKVAVDYELYENDNFNEVYVWIHEGTCYL